MTAGEELAAEARRDIQEGTRILQEMLAFLNRKRVATGAKPLRVVVDDRRVA